MSALFWVWAVVSVIVLISALFAGGVGYMTATDEKRKGQYAQNPQEIKAASRFGILSFTVALTAALWPVYAAGLLVYGAHRLVRNLVHGTHDLIEMAEPREWAREVFLPTEESKELE